MIKSSVKDKDTNQYQEGSNASITSQTTDDISSLIDNVMSKVFDDEDDSSCQEKKSFISYKEYAVSFLRNVVAEIDDDDDDDDEDVSLAILPNDLPSLDSSYCSTDSCFDDFENSNNASSRSYNARDYDVDCAVIDDVLNDEIDDDCSPAQYPGQNIQFAQFMHWLQKQWWKQNSSACFDKIRSLSISIGERDTLLHTIWKKDKQRHRKQETPRSGALPFIVSYRNSQSRMY